MAQARAPRVGTTPNAKKPAKQPGLVVGYDGAEWVLHTDAITPKDLSDLRRATALTATTLFQAVADGDTTLDVFGGLVFLARRQCEGKWINFEAATAGLTLGSDCTMRADADDEPDEEEPLEGEG